MRASFRQYTPTPARDKILGPELSEFYRQRETGLARLEELSRSLIEQGVAHRADLDKRIEEERGALRAEVERERERLVEEFQRHEAALVERGEALAEQQKEFDDRSNTQARRKLREDLKATLKERHQAFALTQGTVRKRWSIHALFLLLLAASGIIAGRALFQPDLATNWMTLARFALASLTFIGSLGFYIKWNDQWAKAHSEEEFKLKRLELDIDRASWLVEMALEWKEEKGYQIPDSLLERLSANLFSADTDRGKLRHPAEDVASALVRSSTAMRVDLPGLGQVHLDRKGLRRFDKELERGDGDAK